VHHTKPDARTVYCLFKVAFGQIERHLNVKGAIPRLWLTFPRAYAFNPLLWPLSFHLIRKVERLLLSNNARRCDWKTYFEGRAMLSENRDFHINYSRSARPIPHPSPGPLSFP
jgi:hypothetical protein